MTVEEYADKHGLSLETVRRYIRSGKLNAKREGRSYVIRDTDDNTNHNIHDATDDIHDRQTQQLLAEKDARIVQLEALLTASQQQVERMETELSESRQRSDSIIMQMSKTLETQQLQIKDQTFLIEDLRQQPKTLWQRLLGRRNLAESAT